MKADISRSANRIEAGYYLCHTLNEARIVSGLSVREKQPVTSGKSMKSLSNPSIDTELDDELRPEYDLSQLKGGVRGKYAERCRAGSNVVVLAPDVARVFPNEDAVNEALRLLIRITVTELEHSPILTSIP
jgi:hypothetical protein